MTISYIPLVLLIIATFITGYIKGTRDHTKYLQVEMKRLGRCLVCLNIPLHIRRGVGND